MVSEEQNSDVELASEVIPVPQVQPEAEALEVVNNNGDGNNISHRNPRRRKNILYSALLKQMEFYFGDSNLTKDRFLAELIKQNPDVDLDVFLRFNKIRELTTDTKKIVKALRDSQMLKVSDDGKKVRRITPIVKKQNIEQCTVYIQRLPSDADHEWLTTLFSEYGPVDYISIPKFTSTNKIKGFAFIEFKTEEGAQKCLKAFRAKGYELPSQTLPNQVTSISTYSDGVQGEPNSETNEHNVCSGTNEQDNQKGEKSKSKKRKQSLKSDDPQDLDQSNCSKPKKKKCEETEKDSSACQSDSNAEENKSNKKQKRKALQEAGDSDFETQSKEKPKKQKKLQDEETETTKDNDNSENETNSTVNNKESVENTNEENKTEKKKKKRKRKNHETYEALEATDMGLQVMSKLDWKRLRNKYLDLQRSKMKQLKQHLRKAQWNQWGHKMDNKSTEATDNKKNLEFIPGVIVKVELKEACVDPKGFKMELRSNNHVKYIDVKEGLNEAFIRCDSSEAAKEISQRSNSERQFKVLTGDEEKSYWDKITQDRQEKIGNKVRVKQRGRDKLLKKAEKELGRHIKFDED